MELRHQREMEEELEQALREYRESLELLMKQPMTEEMIETRRQLEDAIRNTLEVLDELRTGSTDEDTMITDSMGENEEKSRKRRRAVKDPKHKALDNSFEEFTDHPIDFATLSEKYLDFGRHIWRTRDGSCSMDFADSTATLELTKVLLKEYYGLQWDVPLGQLVPPVPCRAKYILWINDLLQLVNATPTDIVGLDVGCGANCIYPLLGASMYGWKFVGTDITDVAVQSAWSNVHKNPKISRLIEIVKVPEHDQDILQSVAIQHGPFHFCMCNPPFFSNIEESGLNTKTAFGGTSAEMVYPGGEQAFVEKMVDESINLSDSIGWYSAMLGKKSTLKAIRAKLYGVDPAALRTTSFQQGKTTRWAIAWSFSAKNTNDKPLKSATSSFVAAKHIRTIPTRGKTSEALISCIVETLHAHSHWTITHPSVTKLTAHHLPPSSLSIEVLQDSPEYFSLLIDVHPSLQELLMKMWDDVNIIW